MGKQRKRAELRTDGDGAAGVNAAENATLHRPRWVNGNADEFDDVRRRQRRVVRPARPPPLPILLEPFAWAVGDGAPLVQVSVRVADHLQRLLHIRQPTHRSIEDDVSALVERVHQQLLRRLDAFAV